jgi:Tat protein secretion system quality control protein TatD with DNase activity
MIDTHCHLYDEKLYDNLDVILENAKEANINKMICIGDNIKTSKKVLKYLNHMIIFMQRWEYTHMKQKMRLYRIYPY